MSHSQFDALHQEVFDKVTKFPLFHRYLWPSLANRLESANWYENRILRYTLQSSSWIEGLEHTLSLADLDSVKSSKAIFDSLSGRESDYDDQLFDVLAEVRLVKWARIQKYRYIEKLERDEKNKTPDFILINEVKKALAEAKHLRVRDYLLDFCADSIEGLAIITNTLTAFGLKVDTGDNYLKQRDSLMASGPVREFWKNKVRLALTADWLREVEQRLTSNPEQKINILDNLFLAERDSLVPPKRVQSGLTLSLGPKETVNLCLDKLEGDLLKALLQIRKFISSKAYDANEAIVFFSGVDEWQPEWSTLWDTLKSKTPRESWCRVDSIRKSAQELIKIPFTLIVGRYQRVIEPNGTVKLGTSEYVPFPWTDA